MSQDQAGTVRKTQNGTTRSYRLREIGQHRVSSATFAEPVERRQSAERLWNTPKPAFVAGGLKLQYGVAEHSEHHRECFGERGPVRTEQMFVVGAQNSSPLFAYLTRDGMSRWRQIWRSVTQV